MKNYLFITCCVGVATLLLVSCTKTRILLPDETHTGANTMGFTLNGKNYRTIGKLGDLLNPGGVSYLYLASSSGNIISVTGRNDAGEGKFELQFVISYRDTLGTYSINNATFYLGGQPADDFNTFTTSETRTSKVTVTYFNGSFTPYNPGTILSGTFDMELTNTAGKTIHLSNGRFDISGGR